MIGGAAQHDAVQPHAVAARCASASSSEAMPPLMTIVSSRPLALQPADQRIVERRDVAVLLRRQALQPGLAGVDDEGVDAGGGADVDDGEQAPSRVLVVDADAALDGGRDLHRRRLIAAMQSATSSGSRIRQAPKRPDCTRSDGQPTLRLISS